MAHAEKSDFVFRLNGRVHLNRRGRQFSPLLAAKVCTSAVVILDTPCSEVVWRVLATHTIRQFPRHFSSRASPCAITFQLESTYACSLSIMGSGSTAQLIRSLATSWNCVLSFTPMQFYHRNKNFSNTVTNWREDWMDSTAFVGKWTTNRVWFTSYLSQLVV
jgi:hypothetical protein